MHGFNSGTAHLVNAVVDSMRGLVDVGVGIDSKSSPRQTAIEKVQAELRLEFDAREKRRKELEFLEKGGNPLDFKFGHASSVSVQSTSPTNEHPEGFVTSDAKGSFALPSSLREDSIESIGRTGVPTVSEPNTADNLQLFDGDNESHDGGRNSLLHSSHAAPPGQSSHICGNQNVKEFEVSGLIQKNQAYARRNRSKSNRGAARSSLGHHGSSISIRQGSRDSKALTVETNDLNDRNKFSFCGTKSAVPNGDVVVSSGKCEYQTDKGVDTGMTVGGVHEGKLIIGPRALLSSHNNQKPEADSQNMPADLACGDLDLCESWDQAVTMEIKYQTDSGQLNGFKKLKSGREGLHNEVTKGLDSESSCTATSVSLDATNDSDHNTNTKNLVSDGNPKEQTLAFEQTLTDLEVDEVVRKKNDAVTADNGVIIDDDRSSVHVDHNDNGCNVKVEDEVQRCRPGLESNVRHIKGMAIPNDDSSKSEKEMSSAYRPQGSTSSTLHQPYQTDLSEKASNSIPNVQTSTDNHLMLVKKAHEDFILKDAQIIQAKRRRIEELSVGVLPFEIRKQSHWDFVLEEMSWLANDFLQERLWKMTAAAQISHQAASASQLRSVKQGLCQRRKSVAHSLAKSVMQFWHSAELLLARDDPSDCLNACKNDLFKSDKADRNEVSEDREAGKDSGLQKHEKHLAIDLYAVRFLKTNRVHALAVHMESPLTPVEESDTGIFETAWEQHLTEESLFYTVAPHAMETFRESIESYMAAREKIGCCVQEEVEAFMFDAGAETAYEEDDGEASTYYFPAPSERSKQPKFSQKKRKNIMKTYNARPGQPGSDMLYGPSFENKGRNKQSDVVGRSTNNLIVGSIPIKRIRTASRPRVLSPFSFGAAGSFQVQAKTDASSGDTNSLQDDLSTLHGGSQIQRSLDVESMDLEKQLSFDCTETSKPKQKKAKHLVSTCEQKWQLDSSVQSEQRDHLKRRSENHQFESNRNSGLFGQRATMKQRIVKHSLDNFYDMGSIPSPVASQMSNMSDSNKFIKMIGGRGKKSKGLKIPSGQSGSGSPWSSFEDQALVVLVHDMGPNWELVSDCMNSTLPLKCIFRVPRECKERHKIVMDRTSGDGADSAEDSGSSQPYPSTLPGIPKGSARQLFQRLQGPIEEETLKSHFEKIISIVQQQHYRKKQNDKQGPKHMASVDTSHAAVLSQVRSNNLNGAPPTPLDLIDAATLNLDAFVPGHQVSHSTQCPGAPMLPASGANSTLQGSSGMIIGCDMSSSPGVLNGSVRDSSYGVPRATSLSVDEQQRMPHYMFPGRNILQSSLPVPGTVSGPGRGVRMLPGGNGMGMMCGMNRSVPMSRAGLQGISSSSMLNVGSIGSSSMMVESHVNMQSRACSGQGSSILRPHDTLQALRPGHNAEFQRHMMVPEIQMRATQGSSNQGIPPFSGLGPAFPNASIPSSLPVQSYRVHSPQKNQMSSQQSHVLGNPHLQAPNHSTTTQQQAHVNRLAKERQMPQRMLQQQQHQLAASNALIPSVQPQSQTSLPLPNCSQIQPLGSSQPVSVPSTPSSPMTPMHQQNHHLSPHGLGRNPQAGGSGMANNMGKPRQRQLQQQQQAGRQHPQQRQFSDSQQQGKFVKAIGRGSILMHQSLPLNGVNAPQGSQAAEKGEHVMPLVHGQGMYPGSAKTLAPPQSSSQTQQQKLYSRVAPSLSKQFLHMPLSENKNEGQVSSFSSDHSSTIHQPAHHQPLQPQSQPQPRQLQKQVFQNQSTVQRVFQQNGPVNSDLPGKSQNDQARADQQITGNLSQVGAATAMPQTCIDSCDVSEPSYEAGFSNSTVQLGSGSSPSLRILSGAEQIAAVGGQEFGQRKLPGSPSLKQTQHQSPAPLTPQVQQEHLEQQRSPRQQLLAQQQSLQAGQNSFYVRTKKPTFE